MTRRLWALATYRLSRAVGHDRLLSAAFAWQAFKYGQQASALLAMSQQQPTLPLSEEYVEGQREEAWLQ